MTILLITRAKVNLWNWICLRSINLIIRRSVLPRIVKICKILIRLAKPLSLRDRAYLTYLGLIWPVIRVCWLLILIGRVWIKARFLLRILMICNLMLSINLKRICRSSTLSLSILILVKLNLKALLQCQEYQHYLKMLVKET